MTVKQIPDERIFRLKFDLTGLSPGAYEFHASLSGRKPNIATARSTFRYPTAPLEIPAPDQRRVPALAPPQQPLAYTVELAESGGFTLVMSDERYPVESSFSFPDGGNNELTTEASPRGEPSWSVTTDRKDDKKLLVHAAGEYYRVDRAISLEPTRILIQDTITNQSPEAIGIILKHRLQADQLSEAYLAGYRMTGDHRLKWNPTVFVRKDGLGIGLVALDDVFLDQVQGVVAGGKAAIYSDNFSLDREKSYTFQWAVYPVATGDYYDLINRVRHDLGLNHVTVDGVPGFISKSPFNRRHLIKALVALWRALESGDEQGTYALSMPISSLIAALNSIDAFLAVEKYLLVKRGVFENAIVRGPMGYEFDAKTRDEIDRLFALVEIAVASVTVGS